KLSPRQKMINMMYLVLLALLAMNVSKEILDAFDTLKIKLQNSANSASASQSEFVENMKEKIQEEIEFEKKMDNAGLIDTLAQIQGESGKIITLLNQHIEKMEEFAGVDPQTGEYLKKDELEKNFQYWLKGQGNETDNNGRGSGEAFALRDAMDGYFRYIKKMYDSQVKDPKNYLAAKTLEDKEGKGGKKKSWERFTFDGPVVGNLAILEALKMDVYEEQKKLLDLLNGRLGVATFKVDEVIPVNAPTATIVPSGLNFETRLYVAMSSSTIQPKFSSSSGSIKPGDNPNYATLTIPANGKLLTGGKKEAKQKYSAVIQVPKATGGTEDLPVEGEFIVRKPVISITSAAVQNLYRSCANDVNIDVPALGDFYSPKITASSAQIIPSKKNKTTYRIIPTGRQCVVGVSNVMAGKTTKIGDVNYKVINPPKPSVDMAVNGKRTSGATPVSKNSRVQIKIVPDPEFKSALPDDSKYGVTSVDVLAGLSLGPPTKVNAVKGGLCHAKPINVSLGAKVRSAPPNTKVYIRINEIYRRNFQNKNIPDKRFSEAERMLSIVVK
ncbi:MAG: hypothetical protein AAF655_06270, partial [Bacteroidota bacterium]